MPNIYQGLIAQTAKDLSVDAALLAAICSVESSWNPNAVRFEPAFKYLNNVTKFGKLNGITDDTETILQKCSWGLGQVMGGTARDLGFTGPLQTLCDPQTGIYWAAMKLRTLARKYVDKNEQVAAYNAGVPVMRGAVFLNQDYVDKVNKALV